MVYIGVDLGGTNIKVAAVNEDGHILAQCSSPTALPRSAEDICDDILLAVEEVQKQAGLERSLVAGLGIGSPGVVEDQSGLVRYSNNLGWRDFPMRAYLLRKSGFAAAMGNDANVAALGEVCVGSAKGAQSAVIITLGTGIGSGVVLDGKILTGTGAASELGHAVIVQGGYPCTCGRDGCWESYASATGLIRLNREAMQAHPDSALHEIVAENGKVDGRTAFLAAKRGDKAGAAVVDQYIDYLACGLANIINIFRPEIIGLSGGISKEGDNLLIPLRGRVYAGLFGGSGDRVTRIEVSTLGSNAGVIGAAMLAKQRIEQG